MTDENLSREETTFGQRLRIAAGAFLRALFRLFVIVVVLGLLGLAVFYGVRQVNHYYESTQQSLRRLQDAQAGQRESARQMAENIEALKKRLNAIEIQNDNQKQAISELAGQFSDLQNEQQAFMEELETGQNEEQETLDAYDERLEQLGDELDALASQVEQSDEQLEDLNEQLTAVEETLESGDVSVAVLRRELQVVKAMELLTRSRLFLVENNLGLAQDDLQSARDLLAALAVPDYQQASLDEIIMRLNLALENLPEAPILAAEDLEIAWQLLKAGLPDKASADTATAPTETPQATATEAPIDNTPTPTPSQ
jgi:chromosome segregation ATPase